MTTIVARIVTAVLLALAPTRALAWWEYGHETVAAIAWAAMKPATRVQIARLLRDDRALGTPECRVRTLEQASVWPDCVKPLKDAAGASRFGYAYNWHFQNVDICAPFVLPPACAKGDCVSAAIRDQAAILGDRRRAAGDRLRALAFVTHFVGDLHQPLHAGDRGDLGGNKVHAPYGAVDTKRTNLHAVWDGWLAERAISTPPGGAAGLLRGVTAARRRALGDGSVADWSRENWVAAHAAYDAATGGRACAVPPAPAALDDARISALVPVVRAQVRKGGLRLARLLDATLDSHAGALTARARRPRLPRPAPARSAR
jgi:hypothetical protein